MVDSGHRMPTPYRMFSTFFARLCRNDTPCQKPGKRMGVRRVITVTDKNKNHVTWVLAKEESCLQTLVSKHAVDIHQVSQIKLSYGVFVSEHPAFNVQTH